MPHAAAANASAAGTAALSVGAGRPSLAAFVTRFTAHPLSLLGERYAGASRHAIRRPSDGALGSYAARRLQIQERKTRPSQKPVEGIQVLDRSAFCALLSLRSNSLL